MSSKRSISRKIIVKNQDYVNQGISDADPAQTADDPGSTRRVRGKGAKPAYVHVNLRLPAEVLEFYKSFPNCTGEMRRVLTYYAEVNQQFDGKAPDSER